MKYFTPPHLRSFLDEDYESLEKEEPLFFNQEYFDLLKEDISLELVDNYNAILIHLDDLQKSIREKFIELYKKLCSENRYFYGCPINIYKEHYSNRFEKHLIDFSDSEEIYFIEQELVKGVMANPYPYLDKTFRQKLIYSLDKRINFLETKANNLGFAIRSTENSWHLEKIIPVNAKGNLDYKFNFYRVKNELDKINDYEDKLRLLISIKSDFLLNQTPNIEEKQNELPFDQKCDIEIKKYEALLQLNIVEKNNSLEQKLRKIKWNFDSIELVELVKALIENKSIEAQNEQEIFDFFSELTGLEIKKRGSLSTIRKRKKDGTKFIQQLDFRLSEWINRNED